MSDKLNAKRKIVMHARQTVTYAYSIVVEVPAGYVHVSNDVPALTDLVSEGVNRGMENPLLTGAVMTALPMARQHVEDAFVDCYCAWPTQYDLDHRYTLRLNEHDLGHLPNLDKMTLRT